MSQDTMRYTFAAEVPLADVESSLLLAILATESLHGESATRLETAHFLDREQRSCVIDTSTPVGRDLNRLFAGFLRREFGDEAFQVERVAAEAHTTQEAHS